MIHVDIQHFAEFSRVVVFDSSLGGDSPPAPQPGAAPRGSPQPEGLGAFEAVERALIEDALERERGNQSAAARRLGLTRYALRSRIRRFGLVDVAAMDPEERRRVTSLGGSRRKK